MEEILYVWGHVASKVIIGLKFRRIGYPTGDIVDQVNITMVCTQIWFKYIASKVFLGSQFWRIGLCGDGVISVLGG